MRRAKGDLALLDRGTSRIGSLRMLCATWISWHLGLEMASGRKACTVRQPVCQCVCPRTSRPRTRSPFLWTGVNKLHLATTSSTSKWRRRSPGSRNLESQKGTKSRTRAAKKRTSRATNLKFHRGGDSLLRSNTSMSYSGTASTPVSKKTKLDSSTLPWRTKTLRTTPRSLSDRWTSIPW